MSRRLIRLANTASFNFTAISCAHHPSSTAAAAAACALCLSCDSREVDVRTDGGQLDGAHLCAVPLLSTHAYAVASRWLFILFSSSSSSPLRSLSLSLSHVQCSNSNVPLHQTFNCNRKCNSLSNCKLSFWFAQRSASYRTASLCLDSIHRCCASLYNNAHAHAHTFECRHLHLTTLLLLLLHGQMEVTVGRARSLLSFSFSYFSLLMCEPMSRCYLTVSLTPLSTALFVRLPEHCRIESFVCCAFPSWPSLLDLSLFLSLSLSGACGTDRQTAAGREKLWMKIAAAVVVVVVEARRAPRQSSSLLLPLWLLQRRPCSGQPSLDHHPMTIFSCLFYFYCAFTFYSSSSHSSSFRISHGHRRHFGRSFIVKKK